MLHARRPLHYVHFQVFFGFFTSNPDFQDLRDTLNFMSSISIANLPHMSRDALSALLTSTTAPDKLAIIDVRDSGMIMLTTRTISLNIVY